MKAISNIAALTVLLVSAVTFNPGIASAGSGSSLSQSSNQTLKGNAPRTNGGAINIFSAGPDSTERVCCTGYTHEGGYTGCASFDSKHCPNYARFTPPK
jgi:hypothetical protein